MSVFSIAVEKELVRHAIVLDWRGVSMVWGLTGWVSCCPAGRAPCAGGDHFVICIPPSGRGSRWSLGENLCADHREARAKPVYPPRSGLPFRFRMRADERDRDYGYEAEEQGRVHDFVGGGDV
jgi:hypothetical protein